MEPNAIVVVVNESRDVFPQLIHIAVLIGIHFYSRLSALHETLATGIVVGIR